MAMRNSTRSLGLFLATGMVVASGLGYGVWRLSMPSSTTTTDTAISSSLVSTEDPVPSETTTSEHFFEDGSTSTQLPGKGPTVAVAPGDPFLAPNSGPATGRPSAVQQSPRATGTTTESAPDGPAAPQEPTAQPAGEQPADPAPRDDSRDYTPRTDIPESPSRPSTTTTKPGNNGEESSTPATPAPSTPNGESTPANPTTAPAPEDVPEPTLQPADPPLVDPMENGNTVPNTGTAPADDDTPAAEPTDAPDTGDSAGAPARIELPGRTIEPQKGQEDSTSDAPVLSPASGRQGA